MRVRKDDDLVREGRWWSPPSPPRGEPVKLNEQVGDGEPVKKVKARKRAAEWTKKCACGWKIADHFEDCWTCSQKRWKKQRLEETLEEIAKQNDVGSSVALVVGDEPAEGKEADQEVKDLLEDL